MLKACFSFAFFCLVFALPLRAFDWETATSNGREYVSLRSFCTFYGFTYQVPSGNERFVSRSSSHSISFKVGNSDIYVDGVHFVMSFPIEGGDHDWLVSRMDVIKLFDPILRPAEISGRHSIRGVVIDPGHGGSDNGATSRLGAEKDYTLRTAYLLDGILRDAGLKTVMTRRSDVFVDLYERAHIASLYPDYCFVSIHFNSAMEEARGLETYCLSPRGAASTSSAYLTRSDIQKLPGNDYDTQNILLASMVHSEIIRLNPGDSTADRGVKRARFVVIKQNVLPAILVEGGFVSNHMEAARVNRPEYQKSLAQAIARGVIRFVNVMGDRNMSLPQSDSDNEPPPQAIYQPPAAPSGLSAEQSFPNPKPKNLSPQSSSKVVSPKPDMTGAGTTTITTTTNGATSATMPGHKSKKKKTADATISIAPNPPVPPESSSSANDTPNPSSLTHPVIAPATAPITPAATSNETSAATSSSSKPSSNTPSGPLNLTEPAAPPTTAVSDKTAAEPDEPPTVNIYPSTPTKPSGSGTTGEGTSPATTPVPTPAPQPQHAATTNAAPQTPAATEP